MRSVSFVASSSARTVDAVNIAGIPARTNNNRADKTFFMDFLLWEAHIIWFSAWNRNLSASEARGRTFEYNQFRFNSVQITMIKYAITSHARSHRCSVVLALLIAFSVFGPLAEAQNLNAVPRAASAKKKPAAKRPDVTRFRARVDAALAEAHAQKAFWGVLVADRDSGETLYEMNADRFFTPASNAKIFTSTLALSILGPDFHFHTTLETSGQLGSDGRLAGDMFLVGRGDPDLSNRKFPYAGKVEREGPSEATLTEMVQSAVAKGLKEVDGDIVADDSYFPYDPYPAGWTTGDLFFSFGSPVTAIDLNDNVVSVAIEPGQLAGDPATIRTEPAAALGAITTEITTGPPNTTSDFAVVRQPGVNFILLRGAIALGHAPMRLDVAMTAPAETAALALKQLLEARGVRVTGETRVQHAPPPFSNAGGEPIIPDPLPQLPEPNAAVLAEHISPPLLESIRLTNK